MREITSLTQQSKSLPSVSLSLDIAPGVALAAELTIPKNELRFFARRLVLLKRQLTHHHHGTEPWKIERTGTNICMNRWQTLTFLFTRYGRTMDIL